MTTSTDREAGSIWSNRYVQWGGAALVLAALAAAFYFLPVLDYLGDFILWIHEFDEWAGVVFGLVYIAATVLFVPSTVMTLAGGFAFGLLWGTVIVWLANTVAAVVSFLIGRFLARDWVSNKVCGHPRFQAIFRAIDKDSFKVVFLSRLVPVFPFSILNYGFSVTGVSVGKYVGASFLGMLPATVAYVYLGTIAGSLARILTGEVESTPIQDTLFWIGGAAAIGVVWLVTRRARQELDEITAEVADEPESGEDEGDSG